MLLRHDFARLVAVIALVWLESARAADNPQGKPDELSCPAVAPAKCTMAFSGAYTGRADCEAHLMVMGEQSNLGVTAAHSSAIESGGTFGIQGPVKLNQTYTYANVQLAVGNFKLERSPNPAIWLAQMPTDNVPAQGSMALRICSMKQLSEAPMALFEVHGVAQFTYDPLLQPGGTASVFSQVSF